MWALACLLIPAFSGHALAGTVENATLTPATINAPLGSGPQEIVFSAVNDQSFSLKSYSATFSYDSGLTIALSSLPPTETDPIVAPVKSEVDTRKKTIILEWDNIPPGSEMAVKILADAATGGSYSIAPKAIKYSDFDRNRYTGASNTASLNMTTEQVPPSAPPISTPARAKTISA